MTQYPEPLYASFNPDKNYVRYVGWKDTSPGLQEYYSRETVQMISNKVTELLQGVDQNGRDIVVPDYIIGNVMDAVYIKYRPITGDIYGRYNVPSSSTYPENYTQNMIDQTIEMIVSTIKTEFGMIENNRKLTAWTTILGDFNAQGLRAHPDIKIRRRRPDPLQFNMNY